MCGFSYGFSLPLSSTPTPIFLFSIPVFLLFDVPLFDCPYLLFSCLYLLFSYLYILLLYREYFSSFDSFRDWKESLSFLYLGIREELGITRSSSLSSLGFLGFQGSFSLLLGFIEYSLSLVFLGISRNCIVRTQNENSL